MQFADLRFLPSMSPIIHRSHLMSQVYQCVVESVLFSLSLLNLSSRHREKKQPGEQRRVDQVLC